MRNQTGARFRSRKVVPKQNLVVYREHEVPDIKESGTSHRSESVVTTGVEKEEEEVSIRVNDFSPKSLVCQRRCD